MRFKKIHFVGIKGVGMTPLAIIAKEAGWQVTGSDLADEFITDAALAKAGIKPYTGFSKDQIREADFVITTGAHGGFDNEEVKTAKEKGIRVITQGEAVGMFMDGKIFGRQFEGISVAGSHGKTTTTAMIATILKENGVDPSYVIGTADISSLGLPGHYGRGNFFVAEADEYATEPNYNKTPKFLWQHPKIAVFTNIEFDHPDFYDSIDSVHNAFLNFARQLPKSSLLVACGDDHQVKKLLREYSGNVITYGYSAQNDFRLEKVTVVHEKTFFWVNAKGTDLGEFWLNVAGEHNAFNALASLAVALECRIDVRGVQKGFNAFLGSARRLEYLGKLSSGALLFDDYAHHPTEIRKTLQAVKQGNPQKKIVCIFQPHTYSRTKALFSGFVHSFAGCEEVIITDIFPSRRETVGQNKVSSHELVAAISQFQKNVLLLSTPSSVVEYISKKNYGGDTIVITMGAGDVYKIASSLLASSV